MPSACWPGSWHAGRPSGWLQLCRLKPRHLWCRRPVPRGRDCSTSRYCTCAWAPGVGSAAFLASFKRAAANSATALESAAKPASLDPADDGIQRNGIGFLGGGVIRRSSPDGRAATCQKSRPVFVLQAPGVTRVTDGWTVADSDDVAGSSTNNLSHIAAFIGRSYEGTVKHATPGPATIRIVVPPARGGWQLTLRAGGKPMNVDELPNSRVLIATAYLVRIWMLAGSLDDVAKRLLRQPSDRLESVPGVRSDCSLRKRIDP